MSEKSTFEYLRLTDKDIGKIMRKAREDAIDECAKIADDFKAKAVAFHIRALKS